MQVYMAGEPTYEMDYKSWIFGLNANAPQILHTTICVKELDPALRFYLDGLGMKVLDRLDFERVVAVFVGFAAAEGAVELVSYRYGDGPYSPQPGFGHIAIGVPDLGAMVAKLEAMGVEITHRPTVTVPGAAPSAKVRDPDGYELALVQTRNG
jgi:lactoylglutathione lyase